VLLVRTGSSVKHALGIEGLAGTIVGLSVLIGFELVNNMGVDDVMDRKKLFGSFNTELALMQLAQSKFMQRMTAACLVFAPVAQVLGAIISKMLSSNARVTLLSSKAVVVVFAEIAVLWTWLKVKGERSDIREMYNDRADYTRPSFWVEKIGFSALIIGVYWFWTKSRKHDVPKVVDGDAELTSSVLENDAEHTSNDKMVSVESNRAFMRSAASNARNTGSARTISQEMQTLNPDGGGGKN